MAPATGAKRSEKNTLLDSINPWGGRSTPPARDPKPPPPSTPTTAAPAGVSTANNAPDHSTNPYYGRSFRKYPPGCPPLNVQWFHAVDVPKRKAEWFKNKKPVEAKPQIPKKYVAFTADDNRALEAAYQQVLEGLEDSPSALGTKLRSLSGARRENLDSGDISDMGTEPGLGAERSAEHGAERKDRVTVAVNEDFLFDVDIEDRELSPVYWLGPVYDVRRGSWFYQEGSTLRPCEENLASQLEEGYLKAKPWLYPTPAQSHEVTPKASVENLKSAKPPAAAAKGEQMPSKTKTVPSAPPQPQTHRLFGQHMNHVATYQDATTAWLSTDGMLSWVTSTMYERFSGGGYMSGVKLVRGYSEPKKAKDDKPASTPTGAKRTIEEAEEKHRKTLKRRSAPPSTDAASSEDSHASQDQDGDLAEGAGQSAVERRGNILQRQLSSLMGGGGNREQEEEEIRKREEQEIQDDYTAQSGETQGREIEHLVLVTHGIGQLLGLRMESLNFIHDVNVLRKTLKSVYYNSPGLRALNSELPEGPGNCRIQVLPVCWRHLLDFPKRRHTKRQEHDLGDIHDEEDDYPSLEDITIEGMAFARSLISDLALDVLLYQSAYREQISEIVLKESNRIYQLFRERNPGFNGTVHVIGHSLGSAIMFDILCGQKQDAKQAEVPRNPLRIWPLTQDTGVPTEDASRAKNLSFDFDVEDFYCLGSPVGLFQMLKGHTIAARRQVDSPPEPLSMLDSAEDAFISDPLTANAYEQLSPITGLPVTVSSPKVGQLFNIFHPSDPVSYRIEPLISPAMSSLKPQALPYTKKGIFGSVAPQGLTGIGAKVGQSVSGLWSSLSAGIASTMLNRSLGLTQEDVAKLQQQHNPVLLNSNASTNASANANTNANANASEGGVNKDLSSTPIDEEVETLYSHFQKKRAAMDSEDNKTSTGGDGKDGRKSWQEEEAKAQRMRREEAKVRALNRNGRVDYSIQESVLDFNPINTIASHMAYWADEDVNHFIMSQLLSSKTQRAKKKTAP